MKSSNIKPLKSCPMCDKNKVFATYEENARYRYKYYDEPCPCIDDNYIFIKDCEEMGFVKGKSAIEFTKGGEG